MLLAEGTDWQGIGICVATIISAIGSAIAAIYAARAHATGARNEKAIAENTALTNDVQRATNGMKTELVEAVRVQATQAGEIKGLAEGLAEGRAEGRASQKERPT